MTTTYLLPDWPAPPGIRAASTLRRGGVSAAPYAGFNLALHVGDDETRVIANRQRLMTDLQLPAAPCWLNQVHGKQVVKADTGMTTPAADASYTDDRGVVCAVMTADCLPVLLCRQDGAAVAALHAGWKGLAGGVLEAGVAALGNTPLLAWLGPAIGPDAFEVGPEVRAIFGQQRTEFLTAFRATETGSYRADLYRLARIALTSAGLDPADIHGGGWCTHRQADDFFSYRRDQTTGRMATLIWRE